MCGEGERVQAGAAFTAALTILQNDLKAKPVYTRGHCKTAIWFTMGQTPQRQHLRVFPHCRGIHIHIVQMEIPVTHYAIIESLEIRQ